MAGAATIQKPECGGGCLRTGVQSRARARRGAGARRWGSLRWWGRSSPLGHLSPGLWFVGSSVGEFVGETSCGGDGAWLPGPPCDTWPPTSVAIDPMLKPLGLRGCSVTWSCAGNDTTCLCPLTGSAGDQCPAEDTAGWLCPRRPVILPTSCSLNCGAFRGRADVFSTIRNMGIKVVLYRSACHSLSENGESSLPACPAPSPTGGAPAALSRPLHKLGSLFLEGPPARCV